MGFPGANAPARIVGTLGLHAIVSVPDDAVASVVHDLLIGSVDLISLAHSSLQVINCSP